MISCHLKEVLRASECIEFSEKLLFLYENSRLIQITNLLNKKRGKNNKWLFQHTVISENILHSILWKERGQLSENYY